VLTINFITQQFLLMRVQGLFFFFFPGSGYPRYGTDITLLVFEGCTIIYSLANQALTAIHPEKMKESQNVLFSKDNKWAYWLFPHTTC